MKTLKSLITISTLLLGTTSVFASGGAHSGHGAAKKDAATPVTAPTAAAASADMTDGEIRKVDLANKKITIKHGDIKNLDMPGMTMVFQVKDPAMLDKVKVGDQVRFTVEKAGGAIVVTEIQPAK